VLAAATGVGAGPQQAPALAAAAAAATGAGPQHPDAAAGAGRGAAGAQHDAALAGADARSARGIAARLEDLARTGFMITSLILWLFQIKKNASGVHRARITLR
jgi:hypothetical protein